ncbi:hypothetical protein GJA_2195 [Janthinobacterium agaricidamnosum NBRC 102515 = DSM 9628]|uniref:Uncharacterized protein n=1 Tax=Janthinobacterium agaricidamnosum NBRC 102515 = DSM 9628 TaxID=1349767 RepID=W0V5E0_9BURK|nr:hypothetical protein GJA_2195 [Janthinobacterium agaricidamnosum NBRC 102515 = DSM 9628]
MIIWWWYYHVHVISEHCARRRCGNFSEAEKDHVRKLSKKM